jgi:hypothetical protein
MAKKYDNDKGFLVIEMNYEEARDICGFGITYVNEDTGVVYDHKLLCYTCNNSITDNVYYVAAINHALCKECCDDFIKNIDRHPEDIPYEKRHYNYYAEKLNLEEI